jgi:Protein of unknown function (DUF3455)
MNRKSIAATFASTALFSSLSALSFAQTAAFNQSALPDPVKVPSGNAVALETVGIGEITYECRDKKDANAQAGQMEWAFVGPMADLKDRSGKVIGKYFGPPATWAANDGSSVSGAQVAVSPATAGNIPLQLVKANPANANSGMGVMTGVTYIQRVATQGGVAPAMTCDAASKGKREIVKYQADYILYKASGATSMRATEMKQTAMARVADTAR